MRLACLALIFALVSCAFADDTPPPAPPVPGVDDQPPAIKEASRLGVAFGAAQRCGMAADELDQFNKLGLARLQLVAKNRELYSQSATVMLESQHYGATDMPQPEGGCAIILTTAAGMLGNLTYIIARAEPDVPKLNRPSPLADFAAWAAQLAVMASHCGAPDRMVNRGIELAKTYIDQDKDEHARASANNELSEMLLTAELEKWGDKDQCVKILTSFGAFFGNLDARFQK